MRSAAILLLSLGLALAQLSPEDQSLVDLLSTGQAPNEDLLIPKFLVSSVLKHITYQRCDVDKVCVPYYLCAEENIITDGQGLIDIRFGGESGPENEITQHSECNEDYTSVCCLDPEAPPLVGPNKGGLEVAPITTPAYQPVCGRRNALGINARIVGLPENESQFGEIPWMAAVLRTDGDALVFVCGASLIHPRVLLTAAHCVYEYQQGGLLVRLGEWDTQHTTEFYPHLDAEVQRVVVHEQYNHARGNLHNDVALLILPNDVPLQEHIDTICLPDPAAPPVPGSSCITTGWGKDSFEQGSFQLVLKKVTLPLVDYATCQDQLRHTRLGRRFRLHGSFTCAGGNGEDACTGDGGSPLACPDPNNPDRYVLGGIVSWGIGCGTIGVPGVYVNVPYFVEWINQALARELLK